MRGDSSCIEPYRSSGFFARHAIVMSSSAPSSRAAPVTWLGGTRLHEHVLREHAHVRVRLERDAAGEHLVHDDAERVDVGAVIDRLAARLLRGHVVRRSEHDPRPGDAARADDLRRAEVDDAHVVARGTARSPRRRRETRCPA